MKINILHQNNKYQRREFNFIYHYSQSKRETSLRFTIHHQFIVPGIQYIAIKTDYFLPLICLFPFIEVFHNARRCYMVVFTMAECVVHGTGLAQT